MFYYDLETSWLAKGYKRSQTQIFEIGIVQGRRTLQMLVNPVGDYPVLHRLEELHQKPRKSVQSWCKLLCGKGLLNTAVRRKPIGQQVEAIQTLFPQMVTPEEAIRRVYEFGGSSTWVAHNGKAFDAPIVRAHIETYLPDAKLPTFEDSLSPIRRALKLERHSLLHVYKHLFGTPFKAHHALDDAIALQRVCKHLKLFKGTSLRKLKGVGPKSEEVFKRRGIHTVEDLMEWVRAHKRSDWNFQVYASQKLADRLFKEGVLVSVRSLK